MRPICSRGRPRDHLAAGYELGGNRPACPDSEGRPTRRVANLLQIQFLFLAQRRHTSSERHAVRRVELILADDIAVTAELERTRKLLHQMHQNQSQDQNQKSAKMVRQPGGDAIHRTLVQKVLSRIVQYRDFTKAFAESPAPRTVQSWQRSTCQNHSRAASRNFSPCQWPSTISSRFLCCMQITSHRVRQTRSLSPRTRSHPVVARIRQAAERAKKPRLGRSCHVHRNQRQVF